jgi:hypothetical protein
LLEWKTVIGFEGLYEVSNNGDVASLNYRQTGKRKILKQTKIGRNRNYSKVTLTKDRKHYTCLVHRLVSESFIQNDNNKPFVNHIDGNPSNNNVSNLEWVTASENAIHMHSTGLWKPSEKLREYAKQNMKKVQVHSSKKRSKKVYQFNGETLVNTFSSVAEAQRITGIYNVSAVCRGKMKTSGGFTWKYEN